MGKHWKVFNIGINDADYQVSPVGWKCPYYSRWKDMLRRCYDMKYKQKFTTYNDCSVCVSWLIFSNFKAWMETQDWGGKELDKDLLFRGNKIYSPDTCVFIDKGVNYFTTESTATQGKCMIGVHIEKSSGKFKAQIQNPFTNKREFLGRFDSEILAHLAWKTRKHQIACKLAESQTDERVKNALLTRYSEKAESSVEFADALIKQWEK